MTMDNGRACELGKVRSLRTKRKVKNGGIRDYKWRTEATFYAMSNERARMKKMMERERMNERR